MLSAVTLTCHVDQLVHIMVLFSVIKIAICYHFHILQVGGKKIKDYIKNKVLRIHKPRTVMHRNSP